LGTSPIVHRDVSEEVLGPGRELEAAVKALGRAVAELVPEQLDADRAVVLLKLFAQAGKYADAGQALVAREIEASGAHVSRGHRNAAELVAATAGVAMHRAGVMVEVGRRLEEQPLTDEAFRGGELSLDQAGIVSEAVTASPDDEEHLLEVAGRATVRALRSRAREVRLAAEGDRETLYERQQALRELRHGRDRDGMVWGHFRLPPDVGVPLVNRVEKEADRLYRGADREARRTRKHAQFAADALARVVVGDTKPSTGGSEVVLHVSYDAVRRGRLAPGELCRLESGDDVPLYVARHFLDSGDTFVKGVLVDGTEVRRVKHFGRRIPAAVRTALRSEAMLRDGEVRCAVPGCDRTAGLQWHHVEPHARGGPTSIDNLEPRCPHDHRREHAAQRRPGRPPP
jgi:hypothetical protein